MTIAMKNSSEGTPVVNETGQETTTGTTVRFNKTFVSIWCEQLSNFAI
jgi:hypothetical protein